MDSGRARWALASRRRGAAGRLAAAVSVLALVGAACGSSSTPAASSSGHPAIPPGPITFGALLTLNGPFAPIGLAQQTNYQVMVSILNQHGGIAGHQVKLEIVNDQGDPATAVAGAQKLINDHVAAVVYAGTAATNQQTIPVFMKAKMPVVMLEPEDQWADGLRYPYFFDNYPLNRPTMQFMARFAKGQLHVSNIGIISDGSSFADGLQADFGPAASAIGLRTSGPVTYSPTAVDVTTQLRQLKAAGADGLALFAEGGLGQVYDGLRAIGWSPPIVTTAAAYIVGYSSLGSLAATTYSNCSVALQPGQEPDAPSTALLQAVSAKTGVNPNLTAAIIYNDDLLILKYAIEKTRTLDPDAIKSAIEGIKSMSFTSPQYRYTFSVTNHDGWPYSEIHMCKMAPLGKFDFPIIAPGG
ncbi:MAG TPA: ABC transporter substrate-binding protein [Acidimicrobiales bacterium]|jgi:branched-chain amino acid transport system substrate-binding protein|nr:ABC transporter substrate-binding protein [Acidimicrobiales bacterium]